MLSNHQRLQTGLRVVVEAYSPGSSSKPADGSLTPPAGRIAHLEKQYVTIIILTELLRSCLSI